MKLWDFVKFAAGIFVLIAVVHFVGFNTIIENLTKADLIYAIPIILLFILGLLMGALNLKILTDAVGAKISIGEMWNYSLSSWAVGMVVPGKVGEFSFIYLVRNKMKLGEATAIAIIDKLITAGTLCVLALAGFFIFFELKTAIKLSAITALLGIIGLVVLMTPFGRGLMKKILGKHQEKFSGFSKTINFLFFKEKKAVILNTIITFAKWCVTGYLTYLVFLSFGIVVSPLIIITISASAMLISLIPVTMSGLGLKEGAAVFLYSLAGVPAAESVSVQIVLLLLNYLGAAIVFFTIRKKN